MLDRVLTQEDLKPDDQHRLRMALEKLMEKASGGDLPAIQLLADRLDGKAAQQLTLSSDPDNPFVVQINKIERAK